MGNLKNDHKYIMKNLQNRESDGVLIIWKQFSFDRLQMTLR